MQLLTLFSGPTQLSIAPVQYSALLYWKQQKAGWGLGMRLVIIHILVQNGTHIKGSLNRMHGFMIDIVIRLYNYS